MLGVSQRRCKMGILDGSEHGSNQTQLLREERDLVKLLALSICDGDYCFLLAKTCSQPLIPFTLSPLPSSHSGVFVSPTCDVSRPRLGRWGRVCPLLCVSLVLGESWTDFRYISI